MNASAELYLKKRRLGAPSAARYRYARELQLLDAFAKRLQGHQSAIEVACARQLWAGCWRRARIGIGDAHKRGNVVKIRVVNHRW